MVGSSNLEKESEGKMAKEERKKERKNQGDSTLRTQEKEKERKKTESGQKA